MCNFIVKKCSVCGKEMCKICWKDYAYKYDDKYYCSYKCYRVDEKKRLERINKYIEQ